MLTIVGYNAMTELGWISAIISRETDHSVTTKLEEEEERKYLKPKFLLFRHENPNSQVVLFITKLLKNVTSNMISDIWRDIS